MKIACVGEAMVELSLAASDKSVAKVGFAGDTLNTAIYLKRAGGAALDVSYVICLGRDAFSSDMVRFIASEDVRTDAISYDDERSVGLYAITTDSAGERSFAYWRDTSAARKLFQMNGAVSFDCLEEFEAIYFSAITLAILPADVRRGLIDWLTDWRSRTSGKLIFDSNYRPKLWENREEARRLTEEVWRITDIALPTNEDEAAIFGDSDDATITKRLAAFGITEGALKCGPSGPVSLSEPNDMESYPIALNVVDTTAAGDSFNGGYLASYLTGAGQLLSLQAGHALAAKVVCHKGAIIPKDA